MENQDQKTFWETRYQNQDTPWDFLNHDRKLEELLSDNLIAPCKILDIGCGTGNVSFQLAEKGFDVCGIDISPSAIAEAKNRAAGSRLNIRFECVDMFNYKSQEQFDLVIDRSCYHFLLNEQKSEYLNFLARHLKPEAFFYLTVASMETGKWSQAIK